VKGNDIIFKAKLQQGWAGRSINLNQPWKRSFRYPQMPLLVGDNECPAAGKPWGMG